ncbi:MAG: hypothetical protein ABI844_18905 [Saprospiraceae bacterium]
MKYLFTVLFLSTIGASFSQSIKLLPEKMDAVNVKVSEATYKGKKAVSVIGNNYNAEELAIIKDIMFKNGTIELDVSGDRLPGTDTNFRGFIGLAFRLQHEKDTLKYECLYLRPTLGRDEDQLRRNHSTQYISAPYFPWQLLRNETPGLYESYADMIPGEWTHLKIIVEGQRAWLYINNASQPTLIVNDLKLGNSKGALALWIGPGTDGYFANLKISSH